MACSARCTLSWVDDELLECVASQLVASEPDLVASNPVLDPDLIDDLEILDDGFEGDLSGSEGQRDMQVDDKEVEELQMTAEEAIIAMEAMVAMATSQDDDLSSINSGLYRLYIFFGKHGGLVDVEITLTAPLCYELSIDFWAPVRTIVY